MHVNLNVKYPLLLSDFNKTWGFFDRFSKNSQISNFMKMYPMRDDQFHEDRQI